LPGSQWLNEILARVFAIANFKWIRVVDVIAL